LFVFALKLRQNLGETEANTLRKMINSVIEIGGDEADCLPVKERKLAAVGLRVTKKDRSQILQRSRKEGYSTPTQWTRSVIKSALNSDPILPDNAVYALRESNRQLAAIGRNLNQIARVLNTDHNAVNVLKENMIIALSTTI